MAVKQKPKVVKYQSQLRPQQLASNTESYRHCGVLTFGQMDVLLIFDA